MITAAIASRINLDQGCLEGGSVTERRLADLRGCFADLAAYGELVARENPVLYRVSTLEPAPGDGQLHYGLGVLMAGKVGREYFMTRGHLHAWRAAAEVYVGLRGDGFMLLEEEGSGESRLLPLGANRIVYVPGHTAHRTVNTGDSPLVYLGIYPAAAGHDYGVLATANFRKVVIEHDGQPVLLDRAAFSP